MGAQGLAGLSLHPEFTAKTPAMIASTRIFAVSSPQMDFANKKKFDLNQTGRKSAEAERLVSAGPVEDDSAFELKLRPKRLSEFIGQEKAKEQLAIALEAA